MGWVVSNWRLKALRSGNKWTCLPLFMVVIWIQNFLILTWVDKFSLFWHVKNFETLLFLVGVNIPNHRLLRPNFLRCIQRSDLVGLNRMLLVQHYFLTCFRIFFSEQSFLNLWFRIVLVHKSLHQVSAVSAFRSFFISLKIWVRHSLAVENFRKHGAVRFSLLLNRLSFLTDRLMRLKLVLSCALVQLFKANFRALAVYLECLQLLRRTYF